MLQSLDVRTRAMFGEYGLYCDEKIVALICDNRVFIKPSRVSQDILGDLETAPPYPGAKDYYLVDPSYLEQGEWLRSVIQAIADALPLPTPRKRKM